MFYNSKLNTDMIYSKDHIIKYYNFQLLKNKY